MKSILLGFEVETGQPVYVSLHHLAIFGMTQKSGKTTTLEALITRSGLKAVAFKTKRGESGFHKVHSVTPYYKPRADWQFIEGLVNVALGEKVKYEPGMRWAIMKVSDGTRNLNEVMAKGKQLKSEAKRAFIKHTFEKLVNYLKIVVPELEKWTFSDKLVLEEGVNVMDLTGMKLETQQIVIASTIEHVFDKMSNTVVVIPEAWEMLPQSKMTPVKWVAERFIRKGASVGNYLWIDSQDIGGVEKTPLRQCDNWLMGRMKEAHEVERITKQLLGLKIPRVEIQTLPLGHFYAVIGDEVKKVYVLPAGINEQAGRDVALGKRTPESVREILLSRSRSIEGDDEEMWKGKYEELQRKWKWANKAIANLKKKLEASEKHGKHLEISARTFREACERAEKELKAYDMLRTTLQQILPQTKQLPGMPGISAVKVEHKEMKAVIKHVGPKTVTLSTETQKGQMMYVLLNDFLPSQVQVADAKGVTMKQMQDALKENGWNISFNSMAPTLGNMIKEGLLLKIPKSKPLRYRLPLKVTVKVERHEAET